MFVADYHSLQQLQDLAGHSQKDLATRSSRRPDGARPDQRTLPGTMFCLAQRSTALERAASRQRRNDLRRDWPMERPATPASAC